MRFKFTDAEWKAVVDALVVDPLGERPFDQTRAAVQLDPDPLAAASRVKTGAIDYAPSPAFMDLETGVVHPLAPPPVLERQNVSGAHELRRTESYPLARDRPRDHLEAPPTAEDEAEARYERLTSPFDEKKGRPRNMAPKMFLRGGVPTAIPGLSLGTPSKQVFGTKVDVLGGDAPLRFQTPPLFSGKGVCVYNNARGASTVIDGLLDDGTTTTYSFKCALRAIDISILAMIKDRRHVFIPGVSKHNTPDSELWRLFSAITRHRKGPGGVGVGPSQLTLKIWKGAVLFDEYKQPLVISPETIPENSWFQALVEIYGLIIGAKDSVISVSLRVVQLQLCQPPPGVDMGAVQAAAAGVSTPFEFNATF